ncbi:MAG TPA: ABC transporter permease [Candidatus Deferrimicrobiaceae bacterium]|nr:ABC transporter permease [Candidatus Deferrimicrobiaceae bacterium]
MANHVVVATPADWPEAARRPGPFRRTLTAFVSFARAKPFGAMGAVIILTLLVMAVFAEWIAPYTYDQQIPGARLRAPGRDFLLGTDNVSRDIFSRIVYGARVTVTVSFATVFLGNLLAAAVGITSGYFRGRYDIAVQRVVDAWQAFPYLVIILSLLAVLGPGMLNVILSLSILVAAAASRVIRSATLSVVENQYVEAARALGAGHTRIMLRHILPNVTATIVVITTIGLGGIILAESALSFLGYGVPPPHPSWGSMLSGSGRTYMYLAPWMAIWPGVAISLVVFAFNMLGDALRDVFDPRLRGSRGGSVR